MKLNIIRTILIILLLGTFYIIFGFSSQNSTQSAGISRKITNIITANVKSIQEKDDKTKAEVLYKIEHIIRKIAHFSIYTVVGLLLMLLCKTYDMIDTSGVVTGIILVICIFKMYKIITNNSKITAKTTKCNN